MAEQKDNFPQNIESVFEQILIDPTSRITPTNIKSEYWLDLGQDSYVVKVGDEVYKFYGKGYGVTEKLSQKLSFYQQVTNDAKRLAVEQNYVLEGNEGQRYPLVINPIDQVVTSQRYNQIISVSPFVPGTKLDKMDTIESRALNEFLDKVSIDIRMQLGVHGVNLIPYNIKVNDGALVVTDICAQLTSLRKFGKRKFNH